MSLENARRSVVEPPPPDGADELLLSPPHAAATRPTAASRMSGSDQRRARRGEAGPDDAAEFRITFEMWQAKCVSDVSRRLPLAGNPAPGFAESQHRATAATRRRDGLPAGRCTRGDDEARRLPAGHEQRLGPVAGRPADAADVRAQPRHRAALGGAWASTCPAAQSVWRGHGGRDRLLEHQPRGLHADGRAGRGRPSRIGLVASAPAAPLPAAGGGEDGRPPSTTSAAGGSASTSWPARTSREYAQMGVLRRGLGARSATTWPTSGSTPSRACGDRGPSVTGRRATGCTLQECVSQAEAASRRRRRSSAPARRPGGWRSPSENGTHTFIGGVGSGGPGRHRRPLPRRRRRARAHHQDLDGGPTTSSAPTTPPPRRKRRCYRDDPDVDAIADLVSSTRAHDAGESLRRTIVEAERARVLRRRRRRRPGDVAAHLAASTASGIDGTLLTSPTGRRASTASSARSCPSSTACCPLRGDLVSAGRHRRRLDAEVDARRSELFDLCAALVAGAERHAAGRHARRGRRRRRLPRRPRRRPHHHPRRGDHAQPRGPHRGPSPRPAPRVQRPHGHDGAGRPGGVERPAVRADPPRGPPLRPRHGEHEGRGGGVLRGRRRARPPPGVLRRHRHPHPRVRRGALRRPRQQAPAGPPSGAGRRRRAVGRGLGLDVAGGGREGRGVARPHRRRSRRPRLVGDPGRFGGGQPGAGPDPARRPERLAPGPARRPRRRHRRRRPSGDRASPSTPARSPAGHRAASWPPRPSPASTSASRPAWPSPTSRPGSTTSSTTCPACAGRCRGRGRATGRPSTIPSCRPWPGRPPPCGASRRS